MPYLTILIPAYNEESRLPATLDSVYDYCNKQNLDFEILVVSDGSTDSTNTILENRTKKQNQLKSITYPQNRGKGFAVRTGVLSASGDLILMYDADGSSPIAEFERLRLALENGANIAIGSRNKIDPKCKIEALPYRTLIGNTFNRIVQSIILPGIFDTQCGFKLFTKEAARNIFSLTTIDGYAFDVEILYIARLYNYHIEEIAINWHSVPGSKVNVLVDSTKMLIEILKISANKNKYQLQKNGISCTKT